MNGKHTLPADIERTSMAIITQELAAAGIELPPQHAAVVKRVIHTTADFDYAQSLRFTPDAVARGVAALRQGVSIVTDTNMAKAGVSKPSLAKLGGTVACFMADGDVARAAQENGTTRAEAAMEKAAREYPGAVLAVVCFGKIMLVDKLLMGNDSITAGVALVVCLTLCVTVFVAKAVGCTLPMVAKKLGFDPAVMASPFITTIVDALSLLVYFGIAKALLGL